MRIRADRIPQALKDQTETLTECIQAFTSVVRVREVRLFGSYARGDATDSSDVDLCIVADGAEQQLETSRHLRRAIRHINPKPPLTLLPISPARLREKQHSGDHFFKTVLKEGISIAEED